jgi:hypothetical protein
LEVAVPAERKSRLRDAAERHHVAILGGPVLDPTADSCRTALDDGVRVFCLGVDIRGFRRFCEETVSALHTAVSGTHLTRAASPPSGFPGR